MAQNVPRFFTCQIDGCESSSARGRSCTLCQKCLCAQHLTPPLHTCSQAVGDLDNPARSSASTDKGKKEIDDDTWEKQIHDEVANLLAKVNIEALLNRASALAGSATKPVFQPGKYLGDGAVMGCANYHGWIRFDNGKRWIVRIPRSSGSDVPGPLLEYLVASEYATLKFLENTKVPAPRAYDFGLASDPGNRVGVSFILMEALPGTPYYAHEIDPKRKERVFNHLADILIELSHFPLPRAGSLLQQHHPEIEVSSFASNRFIALHRYGPFDDPLSYFVQTAEQYLDLIADRQLYHEYTAEAFKFYMILREHAHVLCTDERPGHFFLKHADDKGDHLLIDDEGNVTGIIDWQFARCVPASESFGPSYITADLDALYAGRTGTTADDGWLSAKLRERGAVDIARHMEQDDFARTFCHGLASGLTKDEVCELTANVVQGLQKRGDWRQNTLSRLDEDKRWRSINSAAVVPESPVELAE